MWCSVYVSCWCSGSGVTLGVILYNTIIIYYIIYYTIYILYYIIYLILYSSPLLFYSPPPLLFCSIFCSSFLFFLISSSHSFYTLPSSFQYSSPLLSPLLSFPILFLPIPPFLLSSSSFPIYLPSFPSHSHSLIQSIRVES